jgi:catechol 2,3-dioxygenase-like lactoylglutathione lyase family enzyme
MNALATTESGARAVAAFNHVGLTVSDLDRAADFYCGVFGCRVLGTMDVPVERVRQVFRVEAPDAGCRMGWLGVPGGVILELFAFRPYQPPAPLTWNRGGLTHLAFTVTDIESWHARLIAMGTPCLSAPQKMAVGSTIFYATDPDGHLVELVEMPAPPTA